ncbi:MAG: 50S ribosomal protein L32 [Clostridia bacterium]|nr:50S ribosomal protein L32 [Clostridia bacterium]
MAVPKRKVSHARKSKRRSSVWKLNTPALAVCSKCGEYTAPHKVCSACGYYDGKEIIKKEA